MIFGQPMLTTVGPAAVRTSVGEIHGRPAPVTRRHWFAFETNDNSGSDARIPDEPNAFYAGHVRGDVKANERESLLERIDRDGATVGASIPGQLTVQGEEVDLRGEIFALARDAPLSPDQQARRHELTVGLRRERTARVNRLKEGDVDRSTGESIVETVTGIDRALDALTAVGEPDDIESEIRRRELGDKKRWRSFLKRARGNSEERRR